MYNSTAAALTFSCGSGASVIIPAGHTKVIATDGLGSGGVVHDLLTAVNLAGTTTVDDLIVSDDLVVADDLGVTGLVTIGETLAVTGVVTANAGVVVDEMTLDGDTLTATDDFILDVEGDIDLNTNSGLITLKDNNVHFGSLYNSGSDLHVASTTEDKDILFQGMDGNTTLFTMLQLDASDAGCARFRNGTVSLPSISNLADTNTGIFFPAADKLTITTGGTSRLEVDNAGNIGIGGAPNVYNGYTSLTLNHATNGGILDLEKNGSVLGELYLVNYGFGAQAVGNLGLEYKTNNVIRYNVDGAGNTLFNTTGVDADFQVKSDGLAHMLFVDGAENRVCIGTSASGLNLASALGTSRLTVADGIMFGTSASTNSYVGTGNTTGDVAIVANAAPGNLGSSRSVRIKGGTSGGGGPNEIATFNSTVGSIFNDGGAAAQDFRVESAGSTHMFFVDSSANTIGIGTTNMNVIGNNAAGTNLLSDGMVGISRAGMPLKINRTSGGAVGMIEFFEAATPRGQIDINGNRLLIRSVGDASGIRFDAAAYVPFKNGSANDGDVDLGFAGGRFNDVFATNGTIQTSDRNDKQDIAALTSAEMLVAKRISALFKTFRWKDKVAEKAAKGETARTHTGIIAQDVQDAFSAEGLDAGDYSLFIESFWWEKDVEVAAAEADEDEGIEAADAYIRTDKWASEDEAPEGSTKKTRLGMRYPELLSFLAAYNEQRFAAIETRLTALEA